MCHKKEHIWYKLNQTEGCNLELFNTHSTVLRLKLLVPVGFVEAWYMLPLIGESYITVVFYWYLQGLHDYDSIGMMIRNICVFLISEGCRAVTFKL